MATKRANRRKKSTETPMMGHRVQSRGTVDTYSYREDQISRALWYEPDIEKKKKQEVCAYCKENIREDTEAYDGDDAILCDQCHGWFHRRCAHLDEEKFEEYRKNPSTPFICTTCKPVNLRNEDKLIVSINCKFDIKALGINRGIEGRTAPYNDSDFMNLPDQCPSSAAVKNMFIETNSTCLHVETKSHKRSRRSSALEAKEKIARYQSDISESDNLSSSTDIDDLDSPSFLKEPHKFRKLNHCTTPENDESESENHVNSEQNSLESFISQDSTPEEDTEYEPSGGFEDETLEYISDSTSLEDASDSESSGIPITTAQAKSNEEPPLIASGYWGIEHSEVKGDTEGIAILDTGIDVVFAQGKTNLCHWQNCLSDILVNVSDKDPIQHGTTVAAVAVSKEVCNGTSFTFGAAPEAQLAVYRVANASDDNYDENGILNALVSIHSNNRLHLSHAIRIVVMSFRLPSIKKEMELKIIEQIKMLQLQGVVCVVAAGNDGDNVDPKFPATCDHVLTVGSSNRYGRLSSFTSYHKCVDVLAPGETIGVGNDYKNNSVLTVHGTSYAAPAVAGFLARLFQWARVYKQDQFLKQITELSSLKNILQDKFMNGKLLQPEKISKFFNSPYESQKLQLGLI